jgi:hypothetical protein
MPLLLSADGLAARRAVAIGPLAPLAQGLRAELEPLVGGAHIVPTAKALLSRSGGRCNCDGGYLDYDPFDARHRCTRCGREWTGELHDRFRLYWHQLWLAERVVHASLLGVLLGDGACIATAVDLLDAYATQYLAYPNADNVLGPSRPFFSTYLESIWLLQLCIGLDLLESTNPSPAIASLGGRVRDRLIAPSAALIASYDEGMSNRQVWNNAAIYAAATLLGDGATCERVIDGPSGLEAHLGEALLADGSWYEGENYHLFAHRGLWYTVQMAEVAGHRLPGVLSARFGAGFDAPFRTLLPDLTFPSRRDSQYAVSVRQARFAESCELGLGRGNDVRLLGMLARLYDPAVPRSDTGRARSSADVERNSPATGLTRADLSWRALLLARETLPPLAPLPMESDLLPAQGYGILRRDGGALYAALDYGHSGGGHGHPDRLNVLLMDGAQRWFDDPGTGSYVDPTLHWYRSTLAHTAPLVDGRSQPRVHGELGAFEDAGWAGWVSAGVELVPGLHVARSLIVMDDYLVDLLHWEGDREHDVTLPLHGVDLVDAQDALLPRRAAPIHGGDEAEDGFGFLEQTAQLDPAPALIARALATNGERRLRGWIGTGVGAVWWSALAPDVPSRRGLVPLLLVRTVAHRGSLVSVWSWKEAVADVMLNVDEIVVVKRDGARDRHAPVARGWRVDRDHTPARPMHVVLGGFATSATASASPPIARPRTAPAGAAPAPPSVSPLPAQFVLGEAHYRRSESTWREAGAPHARVAISRRGAGAIHIELEVEPSHRLFEAIDAVNPYDNEPGAINGDGVQLYVSAGERTGGWLLVPRPATTSVDLRAVDGWSGLREPVATWHATPSGYAMSIEIELDGAFSELRLDVLVNETVSGRERRRGQLVLSGADGEFIYLRGDRHDPSRLLRFSLTDV